MTENSLKDVIMKHALRNAVKYKGTANHKAILGGVLGDFPEARKDVKKTVQQIEDIVKEVNALSPEEQLKKLESLAPEVLEKKERGLFDFLGFNKNDKVNTAFPPGPEKYPHMGHAKASLLNYMLAREYNGKFILRFEDTNPVTVKKEYYQIIEQDLKWLGIEWDERLYASDFMNMFYERAEELIKKGLAYVDKSSREEISLSREKGIACKYRDLSPEENLKLWKIMFKGEAGSAILRLKIDLKHNNTTMRDPTIFRIMDEKHTRKPKYRVWPNYDFQNAIMDSYSDITLRLRSKEFELRNELQRWIQEHLEIKVTKTYEFGRFNMTGVESSGRIIREKVQSGELMGWDDPSLTTIAALRRRGFLPEAIKNFVLSTGISKSESTVTWDDLIIQNRRLLDSSAKRLSAIFDPVKIFVEKTPKKSVELHFNPNLREGGRKIKIDGNFFISKKDFDSITQGELFRLMDCINVRKISDRFVCESIDYESFKGKGNKVINWLSSDNIHVHVLMPDKQLIKGIGEKHLLKLKKNEVVQLLRFGFCRIDEIQKKIKLDENKFNNQKVCFWFTHK